MKILIASFLITFSLIMHAQKAPFVPLQNTDKWLDGNEWSIVAHEKVQLKVVCQAVKSNQLMFRFLLSNMSDSDINIDPSKV